MLIDFLTLEALAKTIQLEREAEFARRHTQQLDRPTSVSAEQSHLTIRQQLTTMLLAIAAWLRAL